MILRTKEKA